LTILKKENLVAGGLIEIMKYSFMEK